MRPDYKHREKVTYYGCTLHSNPTHAETTSFHFRNAVQSPEKRAHIC